MTADDFRRIALAMDGAIESAHMSHPDFRANGRIFATIYPDSKRGMVKLTPDVQREYLRAHPTMFEPASGAWGKQGCTTVLLAAADPTTVRAAMTHAWRNTAKKSVRSKRR
jgi:hypothetical protein